MLSGRRGQLTPEGLARWCIIQLLGGWMLPDSGVARVLPMLRVALVRGVNVDKALFFKARCKTT